MTAISQPNYIADIRFAGLEKYQEDIKAAAKDPSKIGTLTLAKKESLVKEWEGILEESKIRKLQSNKNKATVCIVANMVTAIAALVFSALSTAFAAVLAGVSVLCFCAALYHSYQCPPIQGEIEKQAALDAQVYAALGPIPAMLRKWKNERLKSVGDLELLKPKTPEEHAKLQRAIDMAIADPNRSDEKNTNELQILMQPLQERFEQLKKSDPDMLHSILSRGFMRKPVNDPKYLDVKNYCEFPVKA